MFSSQKLFDKPQIIKAKSLAVYPSVWHLIGIPSLENKLRLSSLMCATAIAAAPRAAAIVHTNATAVCGAMLVQCYSLLAAERRRGARRRRQAQQRIF
jgi:hypothetical protein